MCVSHSVVSNSVTPWTVATRLLCPWNSPGKNTGVGSHSLLQGIFLTQGLNLGLLHCMQILYNLSHKGSPQLPGMHVKLQRTSSPLALLLWCQHQEGFTSFCSLACWVPDRRLRCKSPLFFFLIFYFVLGYSWLTVLWSVQFSSVTQSCLTLCDPMNRSMPGLSVHHHLPEFTQTHVHRVGDAIQPSHPLLSPAPPAPNPSQHQGLFQWVNSSHQVVKVLEFQL